MGKTIIIFHTFPVLITIPAYNLLSSICCSTKVSIHDFLLDFRRLLFIELASVQIKLQKNTFYYNQLPSQHTSLELPDQLKLASLEELATAFSTRFDLFSLPFETSKAQARKLDLSLGSSIVSCIFINFIRLPSCPFHVAQIILAIRITFCNSQRKNLFNKESMGT